MSLIHQALKKAEGVRHGAGAQAEGSVSTALAGKRLPRRIALALALLALLFAAGVAAFIYRGRASIAGKQSPAAPVQPNEATQAGVDKAAAASLESFELNKKGIDLYRAGRYQDALKEFKDAIDRDPKNAALYNNYGLACMALGKKNEAEASYEKALELAPGYPEALNNYGALKDLRADHGGAVKLYEKALSIRPDYIEAHLNIAIALEKLERYGQALTHYQRYSELNQGQLPDGFEKKLSELRSKTTANQKGPVATDK